MHSLKITQGKAKIGGCEIKLDDFVLKRVTGYEIKSSATGVIELSLKLIVSDLDLLADQRTDNPYGYLGEGR